MGDERKARVRGQAVRLLKAGIAGHVFPGASVCVGWREADEVIYVEAVAGTLMPGGPSVDPETLYDLASLTKPFVATTALRMVASGTLALDAKAESIIGDLRGGIGAKATLELLLSHRAGLAPWGGFYLDVPHEVGTSPARRWIVTEASRRSSEPGSPKLVYSDLGYIVAGEMLVRASGERLDRLVKRMVTEPLGLDRDIFYPGGLPWNERAPLARRAAPTERCEWRGYLVQGEVHDENCAALGGVAGHAGLFGTARPVAMFGLGMLDVLAGQSDFLPRTLLAYALEPREGGSYRLGWDGKSDQESAAGRRMSAKAFGHLGFTGVSLWCDPERELVVSLLTNRVHPSRANQKIKTFRPAFHDGIVAAFDV